MVLVNEENVRKSLPELEMGIGINTAEVVVGNIGSEERAKFGVVGSGVNMTNRIESYTVGGQILISESARQEAGEVIRIDKRREILPKGVEAPLTIYEVGGIGGQYNLELKGKEPAMVTLVQHIPQPPWKLAFQRQPWYRILHLQPLLRILILAVFFHLLSLHFHQQVLSLR